MIGLCGVVEGGHSPSSSPSTSSSLSTSSSSSKSSSSSTSPSSLTSSSLSTFSSSSTSSSWDWHGRCWGCWRVVKGWRWSSFLFLWSSLIGAGQPHLFLLITRWGWLVQVGVESPQRRTLAIVNLIVLINIFFLVNLTFFFWSLDGGGWCWWGWRALKGGCSPKIPWERDPQDNLENDRGDQNQMRVMAIGMFQYSSRFLACWPMFVFDQMF